MPGEESKVSTTNYENLDATGRSLEEIGKTRVCAYHERLHIQILGKAESKE